MRQLIIFAKSEATENERRLAKLAVWMGVPARLITVDQQGDSISRLVEESLGQNLTVAAAAATLSRVREVLGSSGTEQLLNKNCERLLVLTGFGESQQDELLSWLTGGRVNGLESPKARREFSFPASGRSLTKQFAGLAFSPDNRVQCASFETRDAQPDEIDPLMLADGFPVFVRVSRRPRELFVLGVSGIPDVDQPLSQTQTVDGHYDALIPLLLFLRHSFGALCWHAPATTARLIIDDPLLTEQYGFLSYDELRRSMNAAGYATTIAFIPWNYWRTSKAQAPRLSDQQSKLSICVHGCDHTRKEFDGTDRDALQQKATVALKRMEKHQRRTSIPFERVMVFPQGYFSSSAIAALRSNEYLAAVNTTCFPNDEGAERLTIGDFLRPAVTRFSGFPIFQRRYPKRLVDFAFDMLVGRPVFLVEHHQYFRDGYAPIEKFVKGLRAIEPKLRWERLSDQLTRSCLVREESAVKGQVHFFTRRFVYTNQSQRRVSIEFRKQEPDPNAVAGVTVNGAEASYSHNDCLLTLELDLAPGQRVEVQVVDRPSSPASSARRPGLKYTLGVPVRRFLSELRDNTLAKYPRLLGAATAIARTMKATGDNHREVTSPRIASQ